MKNICIGLFEGETLPESLAAFKDVKLDLLGLETWVVP